MKLFKLSPKGELESLKSSDFASSEIFIVDDDKAIYIWVGNDVSLSQQDKAVKEARKINKKRDGAAKLLLMNEGKEYGAFIDLKPKLKEGIKEDGTIERRPELDLKEPKAIKEVQEVKDQSISEKLEEPAEKLQRKEVQVEKEPPKEEKSSEIHDWFEQYVSFRSGEISKKEELKTKVEPKKEIEKEDESKLIKKVEKIPEKEEIEEMSFEEQVNVAAYFLSKNQLSYNELCWLLAEKKLILQNGNDNIIKEEIRKIAEEVFKTSCTYDELCWLVSELELIIKKGLMDTF